MRYAFETELPAEICWRKDKIGYEPPQKSWMENDSVKNKMAEAKQKLTERDILSKHSDSKLIKSAKSIENNNWRLWMAGELF